MSLTLFPITALILLLSGVGAPVHATGYRQTVAGLRKQFLGVLATPSAGASAEGAVRSSSSAWKHIAARWQRRDDRPTAQVCPQNGCVRPWERKQYRTRFGFAEGAYLPVGPPTSDRPAIYG